MRPLRPILSTLLLVAAAAAVAGSDAASAVDARPAKATVGAIRTVTGPGTGPPPASVGALSVRPFALDTRTDQAVDGAVGPSGPVAFSQPLTVRQVGDGWATWSHAYAGSVYALQSAGSVTLTFPSATRGFQFYAEPDTFDVYDITAVAQDGGATITQPVQGEAGAAYFGFYTTGTALLTAVTITSTDAFAVGEFAIATSANSGYVALGDSYSSGEGAGGRDGYDGGKCHRARDAWPRLMSKRNQRIHLIANFACSGAETPAIVKAFKKQAPQVDDLRSVPMAQTVTVTIGGNDIGFADLITDCVIADPCDDELDSTRKKLDKSGFLTDRLVTAYGQIQTAAPFAQLVVVGYPAIFPDEAKDKRKCGWLADKELKAAWKLAKRLDQVVQAAAASAGATYVSTLRALEGHEECSKDPWMYPIGLEGGSQRGHPDKDGQEAIAKVVDKALR